MLPAVMTPDDVVGNKLYEYFEMSTGDHRPNVTMGHLSNPKKGTGHKKGKGVTGSSSIAGDTSGAPSNDAGGASTGTPGAASARASDSPSAGSHGGDGGDGGATSAVAQPSAQVARAQVVRGQYFTDGPPQLSWRQAELYGLVPYATTPTLVGDSAAAGIRAARQPAADAAMLKGVCFRESALSR